MWGSCTANNSHSDESIGIDFNNDEIGNNNNDDNQACGIANVLQFSINTETNSKNNLHSLHP
ncbi:MAG TPA: hypothetical protein VJ729_11945 [Nitrososphaeraceae archaeon]|nr:hypothetical protein [Nitrososphaeraceae archaeon]